MTLLTGLDKKVDEGSSQYETPPTNAEAVLRQVPGVNLAKDTNAGDGELWFYIIRRRC